MGLVTFLTTDFIESLSLAPPQEASYLFFKTQSSFEHFHEMDIPIVYVNASVAFNALRHHTGDLPVSTTL